MVTGILPVQILSNSEQLQAEDAILHSGLDFKYLVRTFYQIFYKLEISMNNLNSQSSISNNLILIKQILSVQFYETTLTLSLEPRTILSFLLLRIKI